MKIEQVKKFIIEHPELFDTKESRSIQYKALSKKFNLSWQTIVGIYMGQKRKQTKPIRKILFLDIETSPNIGLFWEAGYKKNISYSDIIKERSIICICAKWAGEDKVYSFKWDKDQSDKSLLIEFSKLYNEADLVVGHNQDGFDIPWIKTRLLYHRLPALSQSPSSDTLVGAKSKLKFNSNRLDYIAQFLGVGRKIKTTYDLWKDVLLKNCQKSLKEMITYCEQDVRILEKVYNIINPVLATKVHFGVLNGNEKFSCPSCGSTNVKLVKKRVTAAGTVKYQMRCTDCGAYFTISEATYKKYKNSI